MDFIVYLPYNMHVQEAFYNTLPIWKNKSANMKTNGYLTQWGNDPYATDTCYRTGYFLHMMYERNAKSLYIWFVTHRNFPSRHGPCRFLWHKSKVYRAYRTVGTSSSVTRRVLAEIIYVIYCEVWAVFILIYKLKG